MHGYPVEPAVESRAGLGRFQVRKQGSLEFRQQNPEEFPARIPFPRLVSLEQASDDVEFI
jgi:hypothetical protein